MTTPKRAAFFVGSCAVAAAVAGAGAGSVSGGCAPLSSTVPTGGGTGTGGTPSAVLPGELCEDPSAETLAIQVTTPTGTLQSATGAVIAPAVFAAPCPAGASACPTTPVKVTVDPDTCVTSTVTFASSNAMIAPAPLPVNVSLHNDRVNVPITSGSTAGTATITATVHAVPQVQTACTSDSQCPSTTPSCFNGTCVVNASTTFNVIVVDPAACTTCDTRASCPVPTSGTASMKGFKGGSSLSLGAASISLPPGANNPNQGSFLWGVKPFDANIACGSSTVPTGYESLGAAVTFGPVTQVFQREVPLAIPIDPSLMPAAAFLRHVRVAYSGPAARTPRVVPVADMHIQALTVGGKPQWALTFKAPRLGTYQAVISPSSGTNHFSRPMTHRAVMGISMGGGGTASFGLRHHDLFDVIAPLGGPVDWTWMLDYISTNNLGGFRPIAKGTTLAQIGSLTAASCMTGADCKPDETCVGVLTSPVTAGKCRLMPVVSDPYEHPETFNTWWYEYPKSGNGGTFDRQSYAQIFRDLALMFGNPNGDNYLLGANNLPSGVPLTHSSVAGDTTKHPIRMTDAGVPVPECAVTLDPICQTLPDGTNPDTCAELPVQKELSLDCPTERCANPLVLSNYFDGTYNPDGTFPVITVCDGSPQNPALTPYANTWTDSGNNFPLEVGLAVDYNGNGKRDELEPIIQQGHEPWSDFGTDGIPSSKEPGYVVGVNEDPNGDDYNCQYNPSGTENDHRWQVGEPFQDVGVDGVAGTKQQPAAGWQKPGDGYDIGEGDGKFTVTRGLQRFWDRDAHGIVRQQVDPSKIPGGALTDTALARIDLWTDGGLRDLFNFGVDAQHLVGAFSARNRLAGYLTSLTQAPGLDPTHSADQYNGKLVDFDNMPGIMLQRYGEIDPSANDISDGSGQHVGSASEIIGRLESALYYMGSRWRDRTELFLRVDTSVPFVANCSEGSSTIVFPKVGAPLNASGRRGPVGISLPVGYCSSALQNIRYPVIYLLHGYGQSPQDLEPTIVLLQNFMNDALSSGAHRLVKAIIVYVDGRCRNDGDGVTPNAPAECLQGTFFGDSPRPTGAMDETWWIELMNYMDANYRTLGTTQVDWVE